MISCSLWVQHPGEITHGPAVREFANEDQAGAYAWKLIDKGACYVHIAGKSIRVTARK